MIKLQTTVRVDGCWERFEFPHEEVERAKSQGADKPAGTVLASWILRSERGVARRFSLVK